jgi:hypothetical protein
MTLPQHLLSYPNPRRYPAGISNEGLYKVVDGEVIMTKPDGTPVNIDGKQFRKRFGEKSGELNERETAAMLTKNVRSALKRSGGGRRPDGFDAPIVYPKGLVPY